VFHCALLLSWHTTSDKRITLVNMVWLQTEVYCPKHRSPLLLRIFFPVHLFFVALFPNERVAFVTRGMRTPLWVDATVGISVGQLGLGHMQQIKSRFDKLLTGRRQEPKDKRVSGRQVACVSSDHAPVTLAPQCCWCCSQLLVFATEWNGIWVKVQLNVLKHPQCCSLTFSTHTRWFAFGSVLVCMGIAFRNILRFTLRSACVCVCAAGLLRYLFAVGFFIGAYTCLGFCDLGLAKVV